MSRFAVSDALLPDVPHSVVASASRGCVLPVSNGELDCLNFDPASIQYEQMFDIEVGCRGIWKPRLRTYLCCVRRLRYFL